MAGIEKNKTQGEDCLTAKTMRVFKTTWTNNKGQKVPTKKWYIEFRDHLQIVRRLTGFADKLLSECLGRKIVKLVNYKIAGENLDPQLSRWLEQIPTRLRDKFVKIGLIDNRQAIVGKPLSDHIEDFHQALLSKGNTVEYSKTMFTRIKRICDECEFTFWSDIQASKVQYVISGLRKYVKNVEVKVVNSKKVKISKLKDLGVISAQTYNFYIKSFKQFCKWMVQDGRTSKSPVEHLQTISVITDRRHDRRSLEPDEIRRLLEATQAAPKRFGMTGHQRVLLYRLAVETGLRRDELKSLKKSSLNFTEHTVTVETGYTKNKKVAVLPLRKDTALVLQEYLAGKMPSVKVFKVPVKTALMLKADLKAAKISYIDDAGRYADFHSLRHSTGSLLAAAGVHPKVIQSIMRHSDINLTMSRYTHIFRGQESEAVAKLPDLSFSNKPNQNPLTTGTD